MGTEAVDAQLRLIACLNGGPDTNCTYEFRELAYCDRLEEALRVEFGPGVHFRTKQEYSSDDWHIRVEDRGDDVRKIISPVFKEWGFDRRYSPKLWATGDSVLHNVISLLCDELEAVVEQCEVYEVFVSPPCGCWYEASWQDYVFKGSDRLWFLHLGVSD
jgi:hypothetical protein